MACKTIEKTCSGKENATNPEEAKTTLLITAPEPMDLSLVSENDAFKCGSCKSWFNLAGEGITIAMLRGRVFEKLYCTECKMTAKTNSSPISPLRAEPKEETSATIKPQPFSPISSPFPSTSHNSKPVSNPHSNIIPMAQEQISSIVKKKKWKQRKRKPFESKLSQLGSMP